MKFEIKNLKIAEFASEETTCYQATIYVDGVRSILASNDGHGGPDNFYAYSPHGRPANNKEVTSFETAMAAVAEHCKTLPPYKLDDDFSMPWDLQLLIADQMNQVEGRKHLMRSMKSKVVYIEDDQIWASGFKGIRSIDDRCIKIVADKHPDAVVLNNLPIDEAFDLYREYAA